MKEDEKPSTTTTKTESKVHSSGDRITICGWPTDVVSIDHYFDLPSKSPLISDAAHAEANGANKTPFPNGCKPCKPCKPHTLILFIPGNPGAVHWYTETLSCIIERLGVGYAARGVSYAGHGVGEEVVGTEDEHFRSEACDWREVHNVPNGGGFSNRSNQSMARCEGGDKRGETKEELSHSRDMRVVWTMEGQIEHKIQWINGILDEYQTDINIQPETVDPSPTNEKKNITNDGQTSPTSPTTPNLPKLIFLSHSIGAHFTQCLLLRQPHILSQTQHIIHLMPFFRYDPPPLSKVYLSTAAKWQRYSIPMVTSLIGAMAKFPASWMDVYLGKVIGLECERGRRIAVDLFRQVGMMRNHLVLGLQEIRELPEYPNDVALRLLGDFCSTSILFCGCPDQWAPLFHMQDLLRLQSQGKIPKNIRSLYLEHLRHDYVVHPKMIEPVIQFCVDGILSSERGDLPKNLAYENVATAPISKL